MSDVVIRHLEGIREFTEAVAFQDATWGEGFSERVPKSLMKVAQRLGGVVGGAFLDGRMVGFVYGITGLEDGRNVHWSDILAVSPEVRDEGLGRRLKLFQRDACLARGITRMYWTFDPLESRNAYLNLVKLGAVVREYIPDMYGVSDSPLHRGLGTDRFIITWELDAERVASRIQGSGRVSLEDVVDLPRAFPVALDGPEGLSRPGALPASDLLERAEEAGGLLVPIPPDIQALRDAAPSLAAEWRNATRQALHAAIEAGFEVQELLRDGDVSLYLIRSGTPS